MVLYRVRARTISHGRDVDFPNAVAQIRLQRILAEAAPDHSRVRAATVGSRRVLHQALDDELIARLMLFSPIKVQVG